VFKISEVDYRKVISEALEQSIKEILPPVVTRSVTIALITTKQLVLKDFTYDSDVQKVTDAINQFAKNSAGSLALVTCREPLRIALKDYLRKEIEQCCFKFGSRSGLSNGDETRNRDPSEATAAKADEMD
jgi:CCR4-NOT transcription complex subunit 1